MYRIYNHIWRIISTIYVYITRLASNEIFSSSNKIYREVGRVKTYQHPFVVATKIKGLSATARRNWRQLKSRVAAVTLRFIQRPTKGVKDERGINLLSVGMISERSTEDVKRGGRPSLMHCPGFCQQLLKNYGFSDSVWPVWGLKFIIRPADWEVTVLPTQTRHSVHKRLAMKVHERHGDKAHILMLCVCVCVCVFVVQKIECLSAQGNTLDILWFEDRVLRVPVWMWRVRDCFCLCWI